MVTGMFLIQLEMKQLLLQHQFLFNSKPIKGLTYLINKEFQQMTKKRQKRANGQLPEKLHNSLNRSKDAKTHSKERCIIKLH